MRLQALAKNLMMFYQGTQFVSRPFIFTVLDLYKVFPTGKAVWQVEIEKVLRQAGRKLANDGLKGSKTD